MEIDRRQHHQPNPLHLEQKFHVNWCIRYTRHRLTSIDQQDTYQEENVGMHETVAQVETACVHHQSHRRDRHTGSQDLVDSFKNPCQVKRERKDHKL